MVYSIAPFTGMLVTCICMSICICICGFKEVIVQANKIPGVQRFIELNTREQRPEDAQNGDSCAICLEEFRVGGAKVAEL